MSRPPPRHHQDSPNAEFKKFFQRAGRVLGLLPKNPTISLTVWRWSGGRSTSVKDTRKGCIALLSAWGPLGCVYGSPVLPFMCPSFIRRCKIRNESGAYILPWQNSDFNCGASKEISNRWSCFQLPVRRQTAAFWSSCSQEREARLTLMFRALIRSSRELVKAWLAFLRKPSFLMLRMSEHDTVTALARWERCQNKEFGCFLSSNALYYIHISIWLSTDSVFMAGWLIRWFFFDSVCVCWMAIHIFFRPSFSRWHKRFPSAPSGSCKFLPSHFQSLPIRHLGLLYFIIWQLWVGVYLLEGAQMRPEVAGDGCDL